MPSIQRWYELPTAPLLGRLGVLAPLRPLGLWLYPRYFRTPAYLRGFPRAFTCGAGRRPAALAWARGSTGAALWAATPPLGGEWVMTPPWGGEWRGMPGEALAFIIVVVLRIHLYMIIYLFTVLARRIHIQIRRILQRGAACWCRVMSMGPVRAVWAFLC